MTMLLSRPVRAGSPPPAAG